MLSTVGVLWLLFVFARELIPHSQTSTQYTACTRQLVDVRSGGVPIPPLAVCGHGPRPFTPPRALPQPAARALPCFMLHMQEELMLPCNNSTSCTYSRTLLVEGLIALHTAKQHPRVGRVGTNKYAVHCVHSTIGRCAERGGSYPPLSGLRSWPTTFHPPESAPPARRASPPLLHAPYARRAYVALQQLNFLHL